MDIQEQLRQINKKLAESHNGRAPSELYEPIRYILDLGGKRLRPLLTLFACYLFSGKTDKALLPSLGIEIFHNFTLIHDDIMDNAPLRRGSKTIHEQWNQNIAILSGDTMLFKAYDYLVQVEDHLIRKVIKLFNQCAVEVCEGQQMDMNFENRESVSEQEYIQMITSKTAALLGFSLQLGALIGGADDENAEDLKNFGINLGIGFQLKDDLLDVFGDTAKFGKKVGGDIIANKKTYLLIRALNLANKRQHEELLYWLGEKNRNEEKIINVTSIYNEIGIREITESKINEYFDAGFCYLEQVECPGRRKSELSEFSRSLIERES